MRAVGTRTDALAIRSTSAFGLFSAAFFLVGGAVRVGASGPLLHFASLSQAWGEAAYLAIQVASQALLISGIVALCLWAVGLSLIGLRTKVIPVALCVLGVLPAFRLVGATLGPLGLMPDGLWLLAMASIVGTILWCLLLGLVFLRRGLGRAAEPALEPIVVDA